MTNSPLSRRDLLASLGQGFGALALASLLGKDAAAENPSSLHPLTPSSSSRVLHHPAKAKRVVQLFMSGAASQCDMFDYKLELIKRNVPHVIFRSLADIRGFHFAARRTRWPSNRRAKRNTPGGGDNPKACPYGNRPQTRKRVRANPV